MYEVETKGRSKYLIYYKRNNLQEVLLSFMDGIKFI